MLQAARHTSTAFPIDTPERETGGTTKTIFYVECPSTFQGHLSTLRHEKSVCYLGDTVIEDPLYVHDFIEKGLHQSLGLMGDSYFLKFAEKKTTYYAYLLRYNKRHQRVKRHIEAHLKKEEKKASSVLSRLMRRTFKNADELKSAMCSLSNTLEFHSLEYEIREKYKAPLKGPHYKRKANIFAGYQLVANLYEKQGFLLDIMDIAGVGVVISRVPHFKLQHAFQIFVKNQPSNMTINLDEFACFKKYF